MVVLRSSSCWWLVRLPPPSSYSLKFLLISFLWPVSNLRYDFWKALRCMSKLNHLSRLNPAKKFFIHGGETFKITLNNDQLPNHQKNKKENIADLKALLSRSEIKNHLFDDLLSVLPQDNIKPIGSIAYKLALLCAGEADIVLSRRPKSEWDIAGGAALLKELQYNLYDKDFNEIPFNQPDVICNGIIAGSKDVITLYRNFLRASSNG